MPKQPEVYPFRYVEDVFGAFNEVAVHLSKTVPRNHAAAPC